ncbi:hypothetical protein ACVIHI_000063 [Bradyrhizobium sp. USDA 4524]|nr:hypothetical protein [Bradyrhizobium sp. USDA 4538]MCP1899137.1 hypothetical protein [Bradyrhizobium sp. USDA 4537]MCP1986750.1 hypothetical protein [Bradyrhizobium sp. USDA 4539]
MELTIRGILRGFGLKVGSVTRKNFERGIRECQSAFKFAPSSASNIGSDSLLMQFGGCLTL